MTKPGVIVSSTEGVGGTEVEVTVTRDNPGGASAQRTHRGGGPGTSRDGAIKEVVEKILSDPATAEFLPPPKRN